MSSARQHGGLSRLVEALPICKQCRGDSHGECAADVATSRTFGLYSCACDHPAHLTARTPPNHGDAMCGGTAGLYGPPWRAPVCGLPSGHTGRHRPRATT